MCEDTLDTETKFSSVSVYTGMFGLMLCLSMMHEWLCFSHGPQSLAAFEYLQGCKEYLFCIIIFTVIVIFLKIVFSSLFSSVMFIPCWYVLHFFYLFIYFLAT